MIDGWMKVCLPRGAGSGRGSQWWTLCQSLTWDPPLFYRSGRVWNSSCHCRGEIPQCPSIRRRRRRPAAAERGGGLREGDHSHHYCSHCHSHWRHHPRICSSLSTPLRPLLLRLLLLLLLLLPVLEEEGEGKDKAGLRLINTETRVQHYATTNPTLSPAPFSLTICALGGGRVEQQGHDTVRTMILYLFIRYDDTPSRERERTRQLDANVFLSTASNSDLTTNRTV